MGNCFQKEASGSPEGKENEHLDQQNQEGTQKENGDKGNQALTPGQTSQEAAYNKNDKNIPLGLRTDFGYQRDFFDHYTMGKELGHGQFGVTCLATQKATGEQVAVKSIQKKSVSGTECHTFSKELCFVISEDCAFLVGLMCRGH